MPRKTTPVREAENRANMFRKWTVEELKAVPVGTKLFVHIRDARSQTVVRVKPTAANGNREFENVKNGVPISAGYLAKMGLISKVLPKVEVTEEDIREASDILPAGRSNPKSEG